MHNIVLLFVHSLLTLVNQKQKFLLDFIGAKAKHSYNPAKHPVFNSIRYVNYVQKNWHNIYFNVVPCCFNTYFIRSYIFDFLNLNH